MIRSYKFRLYPTEQQVKVLNETIETCRHLYNDSLGERSVDWDVGYWDQMYLLPLRRPDNKYYNQVHSQVLQDVLLRLDKSYQAFFKKIMRYPKFKRRDRYNSFTYPQYGGGFKIKVNKLVLSCIGAIKIKMHRMAIGTMKRCTVIRDVDQWYACITTHDGVEVEQKPIQNSVGIDRGIENFMALSTGGMVENPRYLIPSAARIKKLQKSLSAKEKSSGNREKASIQLAKAWRKVRNQRLDYCHKASTNLATRFDTTVFEDLTIINMVKNHNLASTILDATWGMLRLHTTYKVERRGGRVILVDPRGTSQICSGCGKVVQKDLSVRMHECPHCGFVLHRDTNSAKLILKLGLEQALAEKQPLLVQRKRISKLASRKQEAHTL